MDDKHLIRKALETLEAAEEALMGGETPDTVDRWLAIHRQYMYIYEHIGVVDLDDDEEEDEEEVDDIAYSTAPVLNGTSILSGDDEEQVDEDSVSDDDDPDDIARLGP